MDNMQDVVISVPDMSCDHCVKTINAALGALPGVERVQSDLQTKQVHLCYMPERVSMQQIEATLDDAGYTVAK